MLGTDRRDRGESDEEAKSYCRDLAATTWSDPTIALPTGVHVKRRGHVQNLSGLVLRSSLSTSLKYTHQLVTEKSESIVQMTKAPEGLSFPTFHTLIGKFVLMWCAALVCPSKCPSKELGHWRQSWSEGANLDSPARYIEGGGNSGFGRQGQIGIYVARLR
ncbi:hypothetical protein I7I51_07790 [Histoplasma capsulatum]|uniref:Uncharacterized protein n=1 Tax=Ajellomyces capsulatus TaxID=5037 RepID=A0A8A1LW40_AJECA|nr:hypothetical protein I7I51_07790 [Histoplasma capsulatum]